MLEPKPSTKKPPTEAEGLSVTKDEHPVDQLAGHHSRHG